ncbi:MAG: YebC/PmpR family DNA-binding transcriptional regulator [Bdellovibrionota bacterium]
MSGHSKWSTIKRKKAVVDAKRGKMLTKMLREITVAVKSGGANIDGNARLKVAVQNAKMSSVPIDKIDAAIKKASGATDTENYEEITYEGYAPSGVACLIMTLTDNKNRTVAEVRHALNKHGGSLGSSGSVSYLFEDKGVIRVLKEVASEEELYELVLEARVDDISNEDDVWEIYTSPSSFLEVLEILNKNNIDCSGEIQKVPLTTVNVSGDDAQSVIKCLEALEDLDDVQQVVTNFDTDDDI